MSFFHYFLRHQTAVNIFIFFVIIAFRGGLGLVARTFGDKLAAFKFPPRTASRLQAFVDYGL